MAFRLSAKVAISLIPILKKIGVTRNVCVNDSGKAENTLSGTGNKIPNAALVPITFGYISSSFLKKKTKKNGR